VLTLPAAPRTLILSALVAAAALALAGGIHSGSADPALDSEETAFLQLLNDYRAQNGRGPLVPHPDLNGAADWYATDMATKNYFGHAQYCGQTFGVYQAHCDSLGRWPGARVAAFGYPAGVGENSAAGFSSAQAVFNAWKGSSGHNANMLGNYTVIGIGWACASGAYYGCYWVTDFGTVNPPPSSYTPAPTASPTTQPTQTPAPTASPSPTLEPTPEPVDLIWDDVNCDGHLSADDGMVALLEESGFPQGDSGCPEIGSIVYIAGVARVWGDIDCSGLVTIADSIIWLHIWANLPFTPADPSCPAPGTWF
jgi:uncharacterized protein YkwD